MAQDGKIVTDIEEVADALKEIFPFYQMKKASGGRFVFKEDPKTAKGEAKNRIEDLINDGSIKKVTLENVKAAFSGAKVAQTKDNSFMVQLPNGRYIKINTNWDIEYNGPALGPNQKAVGRFNSIGLDGIIQVAKHPDPNRIMYHEQLHAAWTMALTDKEMNILDKKFGSEENAALAFEKWRKQRDAKPTNTIERMFQKVVDFLKGIYDAVVQNENAVFTRGCF